MKLTFTTLIVYMLAIASGVALFWSSQSVQHSERILSRMQAQLENQQDANRLLEAEWSYLNRPDRLELLAARYLTLQPMDPKQLKSGFEFPTPVLQEVPTGPALVAQEASVHLPAQAAAHSAVPAPSPKAAISPPPAADFSALLTQVTQPVPAR